LLALGLLSLGSCKFNPNLQGEGDATLQGIWEEGTVAYANERLQYSKHKFHFTCDSVYITINTFAKVNNYPDSCFNNGRWTEYAKGTYQTRNDTLLIRATFTWSNFKQKISGCYRNGQFLPAYVIRKNNADTLILDGIQDHLPITMIMKEKVICNPQPLN
jgi:hypothetical protein